MKKINFAIALSVLILLSLPVFYVIAEDNYNSTICQTVRETYSSQTDCLNACSRDYRLNDPRLRRCRELCNTCIKMTGKESLDVWMR